MNKLIIYLMIIFVTACDSDLSNEDVRAMNPPLPKTYPIVNLPLSLSQDQVGVKLNDLQLQDFSKTNYDKIKTYTNVGKIINFQISFEDNISFFTFVRVLRELQKNIGESFFTIEIDSLKIHISESHRISLNVDAKPIMRQNSNSIANDLEYIFFSLEEDRPTRELIDKSKTLNVNALILYEKSFYLVRFNKINWSRGLTVQ